MSNPAEKYTVEDFPSYLSLLSPMSIAWAISRLRVKRSKSGLFEVADPRGFGNRIAVGPTKAETLRKAKAKVVADREALALEGMFERKVLLRGLRVIETGNGWVVGEREFRVLVKRIGRRGLAVYGIEAWRLHRKGKRFQEEFRDVRVRELYKPGTAGTRWYVQAFEEMARRESRNYYSATIRISKELIRSWRGRASALQSLRELGATDRTEVKK